MSAAPHFFVKIELGGQGGAVPLLRWAAPGFGDRVRAARAVGRYACFRVDPFPESIQPLEPTVMLPLALAQDLRKAIDFGVIDPASLTTFGQLVELAERASERTAATAESIVRAEPWLKASEVRQRLGLAT